MSLKKRYLKTKPECKVTFVLNREAARFADDVRLVGDFNGWGMEPVPLKKKKDGTASVTLNLEIGKEYQFRYLLDDAIWENDWDADRYEPSPYPGVDNSVVIV